MPNYSTQFSFEVKDLTRAHVDWWLALDKTLLQIRDGEVAPADEDQGNLADAWQGIDFDAEEQKDGSYSIWFHDDAGEATIDGLALAMSDFLEQFLPDRTVGFTWADTCGRPVLDAFSGGAVYITKDETRFHTAGTWLREQSTQNGGGS